MLLPSSTSRSHRVWWSPSNRRPRPSSSKGKFRPPSPPRRCSKSSKGYPERVKIQLRPLPPPSSRKSTKTRSQTRIKTPSLNNNNLLKMQMHRVVMQKKKAILSKLPRTWAATRSQKAEWRPRRHSHRSSSNWLQIPKQTPSQAIPRKMTPRSSRSQVNHSSKPSQVISNQKPCSPRRVQLDRAAPINSLMGRALLRQRNPLGRHPRRRFSLYLCSN